MGFGIKEQKYIKFLCIYQTERLQKKALYFSAFNLIRKL
jgi:hypothetical protein